MSSLKEKAKTFREVFIEDYLRPEVDKDTEKKWVRFVDAYQIEEELDARIEIGKDSAVLITKLGREIEALKRKCGELKQKLRQFMEYMQKVRYDYEGDPFEALEVNLKRMFEEL